MALPRKGLLAVLLTVALIATAAAITLTRRPTPPTRPAPHPATTPRQTEYLVFYAPGRAAEATRAIRAAGAVLVADNTKLGYLHVRHADARFPERAATSPAVVGVTANRLIGATSATALTTAPLRTAPIHHGPAAPARPPRPAPRTTAPTRPEPLAGRQWNLTMIGATATGSHATARGAGVLVGVIDTGIDAAHPDIAPNFNHGLSRNFVVDIPRDPTGATVDGPCEHPSCVDPADVDGSTHGTHVASTIGAPRNGRGIAGVAPEVSLVNLRAGQDSGYFFLKPAMDALTYAGDTGIDVVNMSFYIDPWLFNCTANPRDPRAQQLDQAGTLIGMQRALDYARRRGVTLIAAIGNEATDLGTITTDTVSPNYPEGARRTRAIDGTCRTVPAENDGVISVAAVGPGGVKASYSNYGRQETDLAAPGGDILDRDGPADPITRQILAAAPETSLRAEGLLKADGTPKSTTVLRDCHAGPCAYYQYLQGTSMAAPHATGVAAILIGRFGRPGPGGLHLDPATVEELLYATAVKTPCPTPRAHRYADEQTHLCRGTTGANGFHGHGIVNARNAATLRR